MQTGVRWRAFLPYKQKNKQLMGFRVSQELKDDIIKYCDDENCTFGWLIREALYDYLKNRDKCSHWRNNAFRHRVREPTLAEWWQNIKANIEAGRPLREQALLELERINTIRRKQHRKLPELRDLTD